MIELTSLSLNYAIDLARNAYVLSNNSITKHYTVQPNPRHR